jgi:nitroimidazol reductase NimA-like FMN-containing flavoprotein (pyridoxamine 5'-phosphate oxidase superfamily)
MMKYHVRRKDKEISEVSVLQTILKTTQYVTIAMCKENQPYLVSLSHGYDEKRNCIYFHCATEGRKLEYLKSSKVWGQALLDYKYSPSECTHLYASVHFSGTAVLIEDLQEKRQAMECMTRQLDHDPEPLLAELTDERLSRVTMGRIDIESMTGKKSKEVTL